MKMFTIAIVLMFTPLVSQAEWRDHYRHDNHFKKSSNNYNFWHDVNRRQDRQDYRIEKGVESDQLTRWELKKLRREQRHVVKQIRHLKGHRFISNHDKSEVMEHLDFLSNRIRKLKHNRHYAKNNHNHNHGHNKYVKKSYPQKRDRNDRYFSRANNDYTAGLYFRF